jgi:ABC-2 type transport system permease protein
MPPMVVKRLKTYFIYWLKVSSLSLQTLLATRLSSIMFIFGKFIRFFFFLWFLSVLRDRLEKIAGYSLDQLIVFYLIFNLFDILGQFFYRGIYWFREEIVSGTFDFKLFKPINPLFQILTQNTDFLDLPLLIVVIIFLITKLSSVPWSYFLVFLIVGFNAFLLMTAAHIIVAAIGVITTEVDHTIWIFRDLSTMARFPIDIYAEFIRGFLTFIIPIALIYTFPAKALFGLLSLPAVIITLLTTSFIYYLALRFWHYSLTQYSSTSS